MMLPSKPGWIPRRGRVTSVICGKVTPPSKDFSTKMLGVPPVTKFPSCLKVMYTVLFPATAIHCLSTMGVVCETGFAVHVTPPSVELHDVIESGTPTTGSPQSEIM